MKNTIFFLIVMTFLFSSCQKNMKEELTQINGHVKSVEKIGNMQRVTYDNSDIVVDIIPIDKFKSDVVFKLKDKSIDAVLKVTDLDNGVKFYQVLSVDNKVYYQAKINRDNKIADYKNVSEIPFDKLSDNLHRSAKESYTECMNRMYVTCQSSFSCEILCTFSMASCLLGWSINCAIVKNL